MKIETGVMVMKDGKAWGIIYEDGRSTSYGWMAPENAPIHDPEFCLRKCVMPCAADSKPVDRGMVHAYQLGA